MSNHAPLIAALKLAQTVKYSTVAATAVLVFDYLETFIQEVELVWKSGWNIGTVLFILARYPTLMGVGIVLYYISAPGISVDTCFRIHALSIGLSVFGIAVAQVVLVLRTYALWGRNRLVLAFLTFSFLAATITSTAFAAMTQHTIRFGHVPVPSYTGCVPVHRSKILFGTFVILMIMETIIMVLTLWIGVTQKALLRSPSRLIYVLYRDGIQYYAYVFLFTMANIVILVSAPPEMFGLLLIFQRVIHSVAATRIILHVRSILAEEGTLSKYSPLDLTSSLSHETYGRYQGQIASLPIPGAVYPSRGQCLVESLVDLNTRGSNRGRVRPQGIDLELCDPKPKPRNPGCECPLCQS